MKETYKKAIQFIQYTYNVEIDDDDDNTLAKFGLWNVGDNHELDIRSIFLIENKSKVNIFFNKKLVTQLCKTNKPTKVKVNGECIRTPPKYNVKGMVRCFFLAIHHPYFGAEERQSQVPSHTW